MTCWIRTRTKWSISSAAGTPRLIRIVWQPHPTVFEQVAEHLPVTTVSLPRFAESGMTRAALRGSSFRPGATSHARTLRRPRPWPATDRALVYLYFNELDKAGHRFGCQPRPSGAASWKNSIRTCARLTRQLPADTLLLLTADHGMLDVAEEFRFDYSADPALVAGVRHTAGEPRLVHLYFEPDATAAHREQTTAAWRATYGNQAWIITREEAINRGFFGQVDPRVLPRIGDLMVAAREPVAFYDTRRVPETAMSVVGQHGSLTKAEREVPLLTLAAPTKRR